MHIAWETQTAKWIVRVISGKAQAQGSWPTFNQGTTEAEYIAWLAKEDERGPLVYISIAQQLQGALYYKPGRKKYFQMVQAFQLQRKPFSNSEGASPSPGATKNSP